MQENNQSKISKWLEMLQQESWQLELIISGFAIFLVGSIYEPLTGWGRGIFVKGQGFESDVAIGLPVLMLVAAWFFLLMNLIFHVVLRGLWISTIGLRYVSNDIDWEVLHLQPKFDAYLRKTVGSYDQFIERIERLCSIVFAFTFMIIFMFTSFVLFCLFGLFIDFLLDVIAEWLLPEEMLEIPSIVFGWAFLLTGLLYFFDFITLGWLKRKKWMSFFYFPFYRFYGYITLSFLYRPIYYNLVDNKYGRRLAKILIPYVFITFFISTSSLTYHPYFPKKNGNYAILENRYYEDTLQEDPLWVINSAVIPSKYVKNGYVELYLHYNHRKYTEEIKAICPDLKPLAEVGFSSGIRFNGSDEYRKDWESSIDSAVFCVSQLYEIKVDDSLFQSSVFRFYEMENRFDERGLKTILDVDYLLRGEHILYIQNRTIKNDSLQWEELCQIPFWKE